MNSKEKPSDEREFLHDLATPLATAFLLVEVCLDMAQNRPSVDQEEVTNLTHVYSALKNINSKLTTRREILIKRGVPSARSK